MSVGWPLDNNDVYRAYMASVDPMENNSWKNRRVA